jgi:hypothetical protein
MFTIDRKRVANPLTLDQAQAIVYGRHQPGTTATAGAEDFMANYSQKVVYRGPESGIKLREYMSEYDSILKPDQLVQIGFGSLVCVYRCGDNKFAYRANGTESEFQATVDTGDVSISPYSRIIQPMSIP